MRIAVIGTGNVGSVLGRRLAAAGHHVSFVTRSVDGDRAKQLATETGIESVVTHLSDLAAKPAVIIYAGPYAQAKSILDTIGVSPGVVLVDCTNPLNASFDGLELGHTESAGERIASWAPDCRVVKAFNTSSVATMTDPNYGDHVATQFYCGDDDDAKLVVASLIRDLGMEPVDAGPLRNSRYLEATAMLYIHLAVRGGWGSQCALKMLRR